MIAFKPTEMTSRQGKAINHLYPSMFTFSKKRPKPKTANPMTSNFSKMLEELETEKLLEQEQAKKKNPVKNSASFRAISREQHSFATRNKTGSPAVGLYNPQWTAVRPNTSRAPKLSTKHSETKEPLIFTPTCIKDDLNCTFPQRDSKDALMNFKSYNPRIKRTVSIMKDYNEKLEEKLKTKPDGKLLPKRIKSPIKFNKQLKRKEFVSVKNPPNEKRFDFVLTNSTVYSKNKKVNTFLFEKSLARKELFETKFSLPPYDKDEDLTKPNSSISVLEFDKMLVREENVLKHKLKNPDSVDLTVYEKAYYKQSTVRGLYKLPLMACITPRDDLMYRVKHIPKPVLGIQARIDFY